MSGFSLSCVGNCLHRLVTGLHHSAIFKKNKKTGPFQAGFTIRSAPPK